MTRSFVMAAIGLLVIFCASASLTLHPAATENLTPSDALYETIAALDAKLFNAYNTCDLATVGSMVDENLEFYHDKTGLAVGRQALLDALKANICGKVTRELVPGSLEVYPLAHYGAVEIGVHRFHHPGEAANVGEAKFIHVWRDKDGTWTRA
ncbi:MAG: nuclear transport factor 2 family protein [Candidatus Acidiferrales bacterium]